MVDSAKFEQERRQAMDELDFKLERFPGMVETWHKRRNTINEVFDDIAANPSAGTGLFDRIGHEIRVGDELTLEGTQADAAWPYNGPVGRVANGETVALDREDYIPLLVSKFPQAMRRINDSASSTDPT